MSQNSFIASSEGFFAESHFDKESLTTKITWTKVLREAKRLSAKQAVVIIEKHGLSAFIWNPYKQEPIKNKWEVVRRQRHDDFFNLEDHEALEWRPRKVIMLNKTDVRFLNKEPVQELFTEEEAKQIAKERNQKIIDEMIEKNLRI